VIVVGRERSRRRPKWGGGTWWRRSRPYRPLWTAGSANPSHSHPTASA
jgi:hypothetical protein